MNHANASRKLKVAALVSALLAAVVALSACNTLEGAGKDIERTGEEIQDAAD